MRIYAAADLHGRPERFDLIRTQALRTGAGLIIIAGDIASHWFRQSTDNLSSMPVPVFAVRGNTDRRSVEATEWPQAGVTSLHLNRISFQGITLAGISGTFLLPFQSRVGFREQKLIDRARPFLSGASVVVAHPPPRGVLDAVFGRVNAGSPGLRRLVLEEQPPVFICGHIHEAPGLVCLGSTQVVNCSIGNTGAGAVIDCEQGKRPVVKLL